MQQPQPQPPYIGSKISLISKLDIRYEGTLYTVDAVDATIALAKVRSFGTEDRPVTVFVSPRDEVYDFIIFKACDIKDLIVCEPPKANVAQNPLAAGLPYDPAIVSISKNPPPEPKLPHKLNMTDKKYEPSQRHQQQHQFESFVRRENELNTNNGTPMFNYRNTFKHSASGRSSRETVNSAELKQQPLFYFQAPKTDLLFRHSQRSTSHIDRNNGIPHQQPFASLSQLPPPPPSLKFDSDYDFEKANEQFRDDEITEELKAKLEKVELSEKSISSGDVDKSADLEKHDISEATAEEDKSAGKNSEQWANKLGVNLEKEESATKIESDEVAGEVKMKKNPVEEEDGGKEKNAVFYNKNASFFDNISCDALEKEAGKNVRMDWKRERLTNTETFGQMAVRSLFFQRRGFGGGRGYGQGQQQQMRTNFNNSYNNYRYPNNFYRQQQQLAPSRFNRHPQNYQPTPPIGGEMYRRY